MTGHSPLQEQRAVPSTATLIRGIVMVGLFGSSVYLGCGGATKNPCIYTEPPERIDRDAKYLFYLHGRIVEDQGVRPRHPIFGVYEYEAILAALADSGFCVISESRPPQTEIEHYAEKVVKQIEMILESGIDPGRITIMGFSKGAVIALRVCTLLQTDAIRYVILAGCNQRVMGNLEVTLHGRVLSVYDAADDLAGSCECASRDSGGGVIFDELVLKAETHPGRGHGVFYRPRNTWLSPVVNWIKQQDSSGSGH